MPRKARVVINREALGELDRGIAEGLEALAVQVLEEADPPDAKSGIVVIDGVAYQRTPGRGLVERGGTLSYVDGRRVGGDPSIRRKPRRFTVRGRGVSVAVGFGWPGRFQEMGTAHHGAQPFLTPAVMRVVGNQGAVVGAIKTALAGALARKGRSLRR